MKPIIAAICAAALLLSLTQSASPFGIGREGRGFGKLGAMGKKTTTSPPGTNVLLLEDGTSSLLLEDGTSNLCLEGGC